MPATIKLGELADWYRQLGRRANGAIHRGLVSAAQRLRGELVRETDRVGAVDTRIFSRSWKAQRTERGARVFNDVPYAGVIEFGRRRGRFPPPEPIQRWVRRKLRVTVSARGKTLKRGRKLHDDEVRSVGFLVGRAIARRGIEGRHILFVKGRGLLGPKIRPEWERLVRSEVVRHLETELGR